MWKSLGTAFLRAAHFLCLGGYYKEYLVQWVLTVILSRIIHFCLYFSDVFNSWFDSGLIPVSPQKWPRKKNEHTLVCITTL